VKTALTITLFSLLLLPSCSSSKNEEDEKKDEPTPPPEKVTPSVEDLEPLPPIKPSESFGFADPDTHSKLLSDSDKTTVVAPSTPVTGIPEQPEEVGISATPPPITPPITPPPIAGDTN